MPKNSHLNPWIHAPVNAAVQAVNPGTIPLPHIGYNMYLICTSILLVEQMQGSIKIESLQILLLHGNL